MSTYGRQLLRSTGMQVPVSADGSPDWKPGGVTIDWVNTVAAQASVPLTYPDLNVVAVGAKALRFGQVVCRIGIAQQQVITITGSSLGGTFALTVTFTDQYGYTQTQLIPAIPWNISAANLQALLQTAYGVRFSGANDIIVTLSGTVYTITFSRSKGNMVAIISDGTNLTGTSPTIAVTTPTAGLSNADKFGPYDPTASDGRQLLNQGDCFVLNETCFELDPNYLLGNSPTDHVGGIQGGLLFQKRVLMTTGSHSLAAGPTVTEFQAAFPGVRWAIG